MSDDTPPPPPEDPNAAQDAAEPKEKAAQFKDDDVQAINYFLGQKYIEAFKELAASNNQKFVLLPMESAGLLGSIAGIGEIARLAAEKSGGSPSRGAGSVPTVR